LSEDKRFPNCGAPETWGAFDPSDPLNRACEVERKLLLRHLRHRVLKSRGGSQAVLVGLFMAMAQMYSAASGKTFVTDEDRAKLHELLDFALFAGVDSFDHGETKQ
jgi:hypothetical protein